MKIVFFGTPFFAAQILEYLLQQPLTLSAVVTQPDRPKGRSLQLSPSPVKALLVEKAPHIPLYQPEKASEESFLAALRALQADLYIVVGFGQILSQKLLDIPPLGCINVHVSLLPKYRGAAPIQRCLMAGEKETGVSIQKMVKQLDAGDVIAVAKTSIPPQMTFGELEKQLNDLAKPLLREVIDRYREGIPPAIPQDAEKATYAAKVELEEGEIHWQKGSEEIHNLIRAFSPRPGAWCWVTLNGEKKKLKILRSESLAMKGAPGELLSPGIVACGEGSLRLIEVQLEGKKAMPAPDWLRGQRNLLFSV